MRFTPLSDEELSFLLPDGIYDFTIFEAKETQSKAGNDMIVLSMKVYEQNGNVKIINDYMLTPNHDTPPDNVKFMIWKIKNLCEAVGVLDKYQAGEVEAHDFLGKSGSVSIKRQIDKSGKYPDKNVVSKYLKSDEERAAHQSSNIDDELPF